MSKDINPGRQLTIQQVKKALMQCFKMKQPVMMWAQPGIGKSDLVRQIAGELSGIVYDVRLSQMAPEDLRGIPFYNKENGKMDWAPPIDLPDPDVCSQYPISFLFLDELSSAVPSVAAAAYQLILDRRVGKYVLPENTVIVAAGNREADKGVVYRMPTPLANRLVHLEMKVDFDSWLMWATENSIHPDVVGYLSNNKGELNTFDAKSPEKSFATPRTWEFVSKLIDDEISDVTLADLVAGTIGEGLALKFIALRKAMYKLPKATDILGNKAKDLDEKSKEISAMYSLTFSCAYELQELWNEVKGSKNETKWHEAGDNFLGYAMKNFTTEIVIMGMRTMLQQYGLPFTPSKMKNFKEFFDNHGKLVLKSTTV